MVRQGSLRFGEVREGTEVLQSSLRVLPEFSEGSPGIADGSLRVL